MEIRESNLTSSAFTGATRGNYHTAVVRSVVNDPAGSQLILELWPCTAFSGTDNAGLSSTDAFLALPEDLSCRLLPLPFDISLPGNTEHERTGTPGGVGAPLEVGGWLSQRPTWMVLDPSVELMAFSKTFERYSPRAFLSEDELQRIEAYIMTIGPPPALVATPSSHGDGNGTVSRGGRGSEGGYQGHRGRGRGRGELRGGQDNYKANLAPNGIGLAKIPEISGYRSDSDSDDGSGINFFDFLRSICPQSVIVKEYDRKVAMERQEMVSEWIKQVAELQGA